MSATIIETLDMMGRETERAIPLINYGGCCVYAANVARALINAGIPAWGRSLYRSWGDDRPKPSVDEVRRALPKRWNNNKAWEERGIMFGHVQVQLELEGERYTHDSRGTYKGDGRRAEDMYPGRLHVEELEKLAASPVGWNDEFDRRIGIPTVRATVHKYLDSYRNEFLAEAARARALMET